MKIENLKFIERLLCATLEFVENEIHEKLKSKYQELSKEERQSLMIKSFADLKDLMS